MSKNATKGYQFTIANGAVTAVYESEHGRMKLERMDANETWSVQGNTVVKTESEHGRVEITTYADTDGDGIFAKVSKSYAPASGTATVQTAVSHDHDGSGHGSGHVDGHGHDFPLSGGTDGYQFVIANNAVQAAYKLDDGHLRAETLKFGESWSLQGSDVVKTELEHGVLTSTVYSDADGDGIYTANAATGGTAVAHADDAHGTHGVSLVGVHDSDTWTGM